MAQKTEGKVDLNRAKLKKMSSDLITAIGKNNRELFKLFDGGDKNGQLGIFTGHNNNSYSAESQTVEYHLLGYIISKE